MATAEVIPSEAEILTEALVPERGGLSPSAASEILAWGFSTSQKTRMRELSSKARDGTLTALESAEMENYERVGHLLGILQSKARVSLHNAAGSD